jgi:two-component system, OmpR family, sensor kinase
MTAQGASSTGGRWTGRPWQALHSLSTRTPLRTKLITSLLVLVAAALVAISVSSGWILRSYLTTQRDAQLQSAFNFFSDQADGFVPGQVGMIKGTNLLVGVQEPGTPLSITGGQPGIPNWGGSLQFQSLPVVPTSLAWANANNGKLVTVQAQGSDDAWRVIAGPVSYQLTTDQGTTVQVNGTLIVGTDLGTVSATVARLVGAELIVGLIILVILGMATIAVVRANLRPLVDIEETAGEIADGHLNRRVPERDPRTEIGSLGRSLNTMLSQIEAAFHAREESEAAAHHSEERMRRFVADAGHELRTPLTAIRGFAEYYRQRGGLVPHWDRKDSAAASRNGLTPDDLDRIMQRLEKEAARMGLLVEDLLLLARLDQQRPLARQPIDLLSLAADAVHDARLLAPSRTIDLSVQPGAAFLVIGDEPRLRQVIGNLMSNALTHTPDGTPIEVTIRSGTVDPRVPDSPPAVILDVTDHGPGMTPEQAHRAFERFYRADQARTRATGGSGLGLAIVNSLVAAHGGDASVHTAPGQGATFRIALPLDPDAQGGTAADDDPDMDESGDEASGPLAEAGGGPVDSGAPAGTGGVARAGTEASAGTDGTAGEPGEDVVTFGTKARDGAPPPA